MADNARREVGDMEQPGTGQRPAGWIENPVALIPETRKPETQEKESIRM
jgi:hypothetical protein